MSKTIPYMGPATRAMPNGQPIEKVQRHNGDHLDIHSIFYTIQGEGPFCGTPAVFIRLAGCNLQCPLCDTEYLSGRRLMSIEDIAADVRRLAPAPALVVITGGEPFRQPLHKLLIGLVAARYYVQIETNGTIDPPRLPPSIYSLDPFKRSGVYIVCSPKTGVIRPLVHELACCYKYVAQAGSMGEDGLPITALGHTANPRLGRPPEGTRKPIYLQPVDEQEESLNEQNLRAVVNAAMEHGYIVQLQLHKILNME